MKITLSPMRRDDRLAVSRKGDILTINDEAFDFSALPDGATLPRAAVECDWLASDITRKGGALHLTLILPHGPDAPRSETFPEAITVSADGPISLPGSTMVEDLK